MEVIIKGEPKEIAALVLAVQERQMPEISLDPEIFARAICDKGREVQ